MAYSAKKIRKFMLIGLDSYSRSSLINHYTLFDMSVFKSTVFMKL